MKTVVEAMRRHAASGVAAQNTPMAYLRKAAIRLPDGVWLMFYRGEGSFVGAHRDKRHSWFLNLSMYFFDPATKEAAPFDHQRAEAWKEAFFAPNDRAVASFAPDQKLARDFEIWHFRLFTLNDFITPRCD